MAPAHAACLLLLVGMCSGMGSSYRPDYDLMASRCGKSQSLERTGPRWRGACLAGSLAFRVGPNKRHSLLGDRGHVALINRYNTCNALPRGGAAVAGFYDAFLYSFLCFPLSNK